jgi:hypothetical protein
MRKVCLTRPSKFALFHSIDEVGSSMYLNYDEWASALTVVDAAMKAILADKECATSNLITHGNS